MPRVVLVDRLPGRAERPRPVGERETLRAGHAHGDVLAVDDLRGPEEGLRLLAHEGETDGAVAVLRRRSARTSRGTGPRSAP